MTYIDLRPDNVRPGQVQLEDGVWVDGWVEAQRSVEGVWQGCVRYSVTREHTETFVGLVRGAADPTSRSTPGVRAAPISREPSRRGQPSDAVVR